MPWVGIRANYAVCPETWAAWSLAQSLREVGCCVTWLSTHRHDQGVSRRSDRCVRSRRRINVREWCQSVDQLVLWFSDIRSELRQIYNNCWHIRILFTISPALTQLQDLQPYSLILCPIRHVVDQLRSCSLPVLHLPWSQFPHQIHFQPPVPSRDLYVSCALLPEREQVCILLACQILKEQQPSLQITVELGRSMSRSRRPLLQGLNQPETSNLLDHRTDLIQGHRLCLYPQTDEAVLPLVLEGMAAGRHTVVCSRAVHGEISNLGATCLPARLVRTPENMADALLQLLSARYDPHQVPIALLQERHSRWQKFWQQLLPRLECGG